jgi:hypothetical protein
MTTSRSLLCLLALAVVPGAARAQAPLPLTRAPRPTVPAITAADLMSRLYPFAADSMMGREAGTENNLKGTAYIAREAARIGLEPAGDRGTFFQDVPLMKRTLVPGQSLAVDGAALGLWTDYLPRDQGYGVRTLDGVQVVYGGRWGDNASMIPAEQAAGKLVLLAGAVDASGQPVPSVTRNLVTARFHSAAGIAYASMDILPPAVQEYYRTPSVEMKPEQADASGKPAFLYVTAATAARLLGTPLASATPGAAGKTVRGGIAFADEPVPGRNVVGILRGSDPRLRGQFVAVGAHNDHVGFNHEPVDHDSLRVFNRYMRPHGADDEEAGTPSPAEWTRIRASIDSVRRLRPARRDSIFNGADDDGSGTVSVLEIAEALAKEPVHPKRSIVFVWHTAEELGLYGSEYFTDHPTVPRDSIVAQLNIDMIGRGDASDLQGGGPRYLQLIGSHRLSSELGDLVEAVNRGEREPLSFDYQFDTNGHPAQYYCRSDHYN